MNLQQAKTILENYRNGTCSSEEKQLVEDWYAQLVETGEWQWGKGEKEQLEQAMEDRLLKLINPGPARPVHRVHFLQTARWWAAACIICILAAGAYVLFFNKKQKNNLAGLSQQERFRNDIAPAKQQVVLTLPDGTQKILDSVSNGAITLQGIQAIKKDGSITYLQSKTETVAFNTITTEKGRVFHLQLSDGTGVWLDALSSIRFPTSFTAGERVVEVSGQAYFEVASLPLPLPTGREGTKGSSKASHGKMPFKVKSGNQVVEVMGTHFNVNAYPNEGAIKTTLLEGKVKVTTNYEARSTGSTSHSTDQITLQPGQQAVNSPHSPLTIDHSPDIDEVMAWKNGRFQFNGSNVQQIMEQLSRWYNIEVIHKDPINETFVADIERDLPLSQLLALLEMTKQIKFVMEGNKITVMKW